ncbi:hypothetical protein ACTGJ9_038360 [Bradyrhizobium sp. RDM12]
MAVRDTALMSVLDAGLALEAHIVGYQQWELMLAIGDDFGFVLKRKSWYFRFGSFAPVKIRSATEPRCFHLQRYSN